MEKNNDEAKQNYFSSNQQCCSRNLSYGNKASGIKVWGLCQTKRGPTTRPAQITEMVVEYSSYTRQTDHHPLPLLVHYSLPPLVHHPLPPLSKFFFGRTFDLVSESNLLLLILLARAIRCHAYSSVYTSTTLFFWTLQRTLCSASISTFCTSLARPDLAPRDYLCTAHPGFPFNSMF